MKHPSTKTPAQIAAEADCSVQLINRYTVTRNRDGLKFTRVAQNTISYNAEARKLIRTIKESNCRKAAQRRRK
ncbi:MAG: hypothetical protein HGA87_02640 [Desulfobulbaceae bacterium]|nr:hypothetical protein [Desulfobulbaceae bacterium]